MQITVLFVEFENFRRAVYSKCSKDGGLDDLTENVKEKLKPS